MQKALWLTALAFVATAVVTVTVAEYGQNHPNTTVGHLVRTLKGATVTSGQPGSVAMLGNPMADLSELDDRAALRDLKILAMAKTTPEPGLRRRAEDFSDMIVPAVAVGVATIRDDEEDCCSWCKAFCGDWFAHSCCKAQLKLCDLRQTAGQVCQAIVQSYAQELEVAAKAPRQECCPLPCGFWQFVEDDDPPTDCKAKPCCQPKPCCTQTPCIATTVTICPPRMPPPRPEPATCCQPTIQVMCPPMMPQPYCIPIQQPGGQTFVYRVALPMMPNNLSMPAHPPCCMPTPCCPPQGHVICAPCMPQPCGQMQGYAIGAPCMPQPCCQVHGYAVGAPCMPQPCGMGMPCPANCCGMMQPHSCGNGQQMMVVRMMPYPGMPAQSPMQDVVMFNPGWNKANAAMPMMPHPVIAWQNGTFTQNVQPLMMVNAWQQHGGMGTVGWVMVAHPAPMCPPCPAPCPVAPVVCCPPCPPGCCTPAPQSQFIMAKPCAPGCCQERRVVVIHGEADKKCAKPCCEVEIATDGQTKGKATKSASFTIEINIRLDSDKAKKSTVEKKCCEGCCEECAKYVELKVQMRKMLEACEKMESTGCKCGQGCKCCETPCSEKGKSEKPATCPGCCGEKKKPTSYTKPCEPETKTDPALQPAGFVGAAAATKMPMRLMMRIIPIGDLLDENTSEEKFVETCMKMVSPDTWQENGGYGQMVYYGPGRSLIVRQTPEVLEEVEEYITKLRDQVKPPFPPDNKDEGTFWLPFFDFEQFIMQTVQPTRTELPGQPPMILELVPVSPHDPSVPGFVPAPATPEKLPSCIFPAGFVEAAHKAPPVMETNTNLFLQMLVPYYSFPQFPEKK